MSSGEGNTADNLAFLSTDALDAQVEGCTLVKDGQNKVVYRGPEADEPTREVLVSDGSENKWVPLIAIVDHFRYRLTDVGFETEEGPATKLAYLPDTTADRKSANEFAL